MSGLDKIIDKINMQAKAEAGKLTEEAELAVVEIEKKSGYKLDKEISKIEAKRERERQLLGERMISNGELDARKMVLAKKQELMDRAYEETLSELKNISDQDYISYMKGKISRQDAEVILQEGRAAAVKSAMPELKISDEKTVSSGFIEVVENIENNYTFEALLHIEKDESQTELANILFK